MNAATATRSEEWMVTTLGKFVGERGKTVNPVNTPHQKFELYSVPRFPSGKPEIVTGSAIGSSKQLVAPRSVLLCKINPRINRAWIVGNFTTHTKVASTEWIVFPPQREVAPEFLCYFLQQNQVRDFLAHNASGVGGSLMRVKPATLRDFPFAYPRLDHQRQIVAEIEKQFTRLDAGVTALRRAQANLKRYRAAVLKAACEGRLVPTEAELAKAESRIFETGEQLLARILADRRKNWHGRGKYKEPAAPDTSNLPLLPEGWTWATVGQLAAPDANSITDGPFGSNLKTAHYTDGGPRVVRLQNIGDGIFVDEHAHISEDHFARLQKHRIEAGDLLIAALGESLPRSCISPSFLGPAIVKADCIRFKPHRYGLNRFINIILNSEPVRKRTAKIVHGVGRPRLNLGEIKAINIPLPPLAEQTRIVSEVERRLSVIEGLEAAVTANLQRATRLRQSILQRAFATRR